MNNVLKRIIALIIAGIVFVVLISVVFLFNDVRNARTIENGDKLTGQRIGVISGWESDYYLSNRKDITLKRYDTMADLFMSLNYKQVDAIAIDSVTYAMAKRSIAGIKELDDPLVTTNYCVYVKKHDTELLNKVNDFFEYFKNSDEYDEFVEHYYDMDWINNGELTKQTGTGDTLRVGYIIDYYPFEYVEADGEIRGNEVELIIQLANYYNMKLEFVPATSESFAMAIKNNMVDVIIASINDMYRSETEQETSSVDTTDGYIESKIHCVVADGKMEISNNELFESE